MILLISDRTQKMTVEERIEQIKERTMGGKVDLLEEIKSQREIDDAIRTVENQYGTTVKVAKQEEVQSLDERLTRIESHLELG